MQKHIIKANGDSVPFLSEKVVTSLMRAGASKQVAEEVAQTVEKKIQNGMTTKDVYSLAFHLLKKKGKRPVAARYSLKKAIMDLGPTGFPFEQFVAAVLEQRGYETHVGQTIQGACVSHEVDVVAKKENAHYFVECKFHGKKGYNTDVKVPLYIYARFLDIHDTFEHADETEDEHQQWIVTNTRFSGDAKAYAKCKGIQLIGWRYPNEGGLETLVEEAGLHPVTCLTTLSEKEKQALLDKGIVLCKDLHQNETILAEISISKLKHQRILDEVAGVCATNVPVGIRS